MHLSSLPKDCLRLIFLDSLDYLSYSLLKKSFRNLRFLSKEISKIISSEMFQKLMFERFFGDKITSQEIFTIKKSFPPEFTGSKYCKYFSWKGYLIVEYFNSLSRFCR